MRILAGAWQAKRLDFEREAWIVVKKNQKKLLKRTVRETMLNSTPRQRR